MSASELTDRAYWEGYYSKSIVTRDQIMQICGKYDSLLDKLVAACEHKPQSIIEIGAYPGRYIAYLAHRYELEATALDYNSDVRRIEEAFAAMNVSKYHLIQTDFLTYEPRRLYDLVFSNGFVEHFGNYEEVLDLHSKYIAPGGALLIMIPNKRYLRHLYGLLVDYANLKAHNLHCMNLRTLRDFARRNQLQLCQLGYLGGFPFQVHQDLNFVQRIIYQVVRRTFKVVNGRIERRPNRFLSATIFAVVKKCS